MSGWYISLKRIQWDNVLGLLHPHFRFWMTQFSVYLPNSSSSIKWNSIRTGGPAQWIGIKAIHKTIRGWWGGCQGVKWSRRWWGSRGQGVQTAGSRSKNSATNQKRAYGLGTHWVHSYAALDIMGVYARCTELVRSGYGLKGGWDDNIGLNRCRINF